MNKDQKGDLVEQLIFNAFKDRYFRSSEAFYQLIKRDYGYDATPELYRRIINYQIKKYGISLHNVTEREYQKYFYQKEHSYRMQKSKKTAKYHKDRRNLERIEKDGENKLKKTISK